MVTQDSSSHYSIVKIAAHGYVTFIDSDVFLSYIPSENIIILLKYITRANCMSLPVYRLLITARATCKPSATCIL